MQAPEDAGKEAVEEKPTASATQTKTETKANPLNADFEKLVRETLDKWNIEGVAVAVVDGDETWTAGYGLAAPDTPVTPSTLFYTGSTTKSFTAAAASLLVDDNDTYPQVQWTTAMSQLMRDDFVLSNEYATAHVTLEDALSHRSGVPGQVLTVGKPNTSVRDYVRLLRHFPINKEIRTTWQYCNGLFIAVGHMVDVVTGEAFSAFLKRRIWGPLGMDSTFLSLEEAQAYVASPENKDGAVVALPYQWDESSGENNAIPYFTGVLGGAGGVISTVTDYAKYSRCIMRKSEPISQEGHAALRQPRSIVPVSFVPQLKKHMLYSLGWMITTYEGEDVMLHPGGIEGMTATMICFPEREYCVLVFSNSDSAGRETLAWHLIDEVLGVPADKRVDLFALMQKNKAESKERNTREAGLKRLYPTIPSPPRPLSLPLEEYTGIYRHPAYPEFTISLTPDNELRVDMDGAFPAHIDLQHASADYFVARMFYSPYSADVDLVVKAEFKLGVDGKVERFGVVLDFANMPDTLVWFDRVKDKKEKK